MHSVIQPGSVSGTITAPPSKSYTHRALILGALAHGTSTIHRTLIADDTLYTLAACKALGVTVKIHGTTVTITGCNGQPKAPAHNKPLSCGASGTTARLMTSVAALCQDWVMIDGESRLRQRPMRTLMDALVQQGVTVEYAKDHGYLPLRVKSSGLAGGTLSLNAGVSSQYVSSLLLVSPFAREDTTISVTAKRSTPYIDITLDMMATFGVRSSQLDNGYFVEHGQHYTAQNYTVEGDYSSASYFLAAAAVTGATITVQGLRLNSAQGDKEIITILEQMGCSVTTKTDSITLTGKPLVGITMDMGNYPDIVPTVCAVAPYAVTPTTITNISHLRQKETDRIEAVVTELKKMGARIDATDDSITIHPSSLHGASLKTYDDHRMAMSFAVAALGATESTVIQCADVVSKSYPDFWEDFKKIGVKFSVIT